MKIERPLPEDAYYPNNFGQTINHLLNFRRVIVHRENISRIYDFLKKHDIKTETNILIFFPSYMEVLFQKRKNPLEHFVLNISRNHGVPFSKIQECITLASLQEKSRSNFTISI